MCTVRPVAEAVPPLCSTDELGECWAAGDLAQHGKARWAAANGEDPASACGNPAGGKLCADAAAAGRDALEPCLSSRSQDSSPVRRALARAGRARGPLDRSSSVPDSNTPPAPPPLRVNRNAPLADLSEIGAEESAVDDRQSAWTGELRDGARDPDALYRHTDAGAWAARGEHAGTWQYVPSSLDGDMDSGHCEPGTIGDVIGDVANHEDCAVSPGDEAPRTNGVPRPINHMTKSMLCLNEETQDEVSHSHSQLISLTYEVSRASGLQCSMMVREWG